MIWNINCRRTRRLLALWAGSDLEQRESRVAERHLAVCPGCREVWEQLQQSQQLLEKVRAASLPDTAVAESPANAGNWSGISVWPSVARNIRSIDKRSTNDWSGTSNWRDWLPAGAVAAACVAIMAVVLPEPLPESVSPSVIEAYPAAFGVKSINLNRVGVQDLNQLLAPSKDDNQPKF
jgi:hypothetical protein